MFVSGQCSIKFNRTIMKTKILVLSATVLFVIAIFSACKKDNSSSSTNNTDEASIQSDDQARFSNATDATANDADAALELSPSFSGRLDRSQVTFCNAAAVYDSVSNPRTITITYNGADCFGSTTRTGVVVLSMAQGVHWKNAGAAITITYQNLKITR